MVYDERETASSIHRSSPILWSLPIAPFSALGVSHIMYYITLRYLLTYLLTHTKPSDLDNDPPFVVVT